MVSHRAQSAAILDYLATGRTLTRLGAISRFGCVNLPGRAYDLREAGHRVIATMVKKGRKRIGVWRLER